MTVDAIDVKEALRSFREDALFFNDSHSEFLRLYPDQWVGRCTINMWRGRTRTSAVFWMT